jgi:secreted PhoX family phosphatase
MKRTKDNDMSHDSTKSDAGATVEKLSRREFAKTSMAAGAVAVTIPGVMQAAQQSSDGALATAMPTQKAGSGRVEHRDGTTIPAEYYYKMEHYLKDGRLYRRKLVVDGRSCQPDSRSG